MPWDAHLPNLGFSSATPWLPLGPQHRALAVSEQERDRGSTLNFFRAMMQERATIAALRTGDLKLLDTPLPLIAFTRGDEVHCVFNLGADAMRWTVPGGARSLAFPCPGQTSQEGDILTLGPFSAWFGALQGF
jgi:alpha-glucosidase